MPFDNRFALVEAHGQAPARARHERTSSAAAASCRGAGSPRRRAARTASSTSRSRSAASRSPTTRRYKLVTSDFLASGGDGLIGRLKLPDGAITDDRRDHPRRDGRRAAQAEAAGTIDPTTLFDRRAQAPRLRRQAAGERAAGRSRRRSLNDDVVPDELAAEAGAAAGRLRRYAAALARVLAEMGRLPPLVTSWEVENLRGELARAARGEAFVLQGGDCAESFDDCRSEPIAAKLKILLQMCARARPRHAQAGDPHRPHRRASTRSRAPPTPRPAATSRCPRTAATSSTATRSPPRIASPIRR